MDLLLFRPSRRLIIMRGEIRLSPDPSLPTFELRISRRFSMSPFVLSYFRVFVIVFPFPPLQPSAECLLCRTNCISRSAHEGVRSYKTREFAVKNVPNEPPKNRPPPRRPVYCLLLAVCYFFPAAFGAGLGAGPPGRGPKFLAGAMGALPPLALACRPLKNAFQRCTPRAPKSLPEALA